jgi:hypothetical protein
MKAGSALSMSVVVLPRARTTPALPATVAPNTAPSRMDEYRADPKGDFLMAAEERVKGIDPYRSGSSERQRQG